MYLYLYISVCAAKKEGVKAPVRMAIIKKSTNNKCWRRCGEKGMLLHCWWSRTCRDERCPGLGLQNCQSASSFLFCREPVNCALLRCWRPRRTHTGLGSGCFWSNSAFSSSFSTLPSSAEIHLFASSHSSTCFGSVSSSSSKDQES